MSQAEPAGLRELRKRASSVFTVVLWVHVPLLTAIAAWNHNDPLSVAGAAVALSAIGTLAAWYSPDGPVGRLGIACALIGMPMLLVHAGAGMWQIDYHLYFFVIFAMLSAYVDWRPIALAATLTVLHDLLLDFIILRVILQSLIVVAECGVLFWMTNRVRALFVAADAENRRATEALAESQRLRDRLSEEATAKTGALAEAQRALDDAREAANNAARQEARRIESERTTALQREAIVRDVVGRLDSSVRDVVEDVLAASQQMLTAARSAERLASETRDEIDRVSGIAAESGAQIGEVAIAAGQLSSTSADILDRMQRALHVGQRAVRESAHGATLASTLTEAAERIDAVTTLIESVADQTRLLSLNAAIEAARAGETGRGFAVVAEEVRKLAEATSSATSEIGHVVATMRRASKDVAAALGEIDASVGELTSAATDVASAVEEQSSATKTIADNVGTVARGTREIQDAIARVADASLRVGTSAGEVLLGADSVVGRNERLRDSVGQVTQELLSTGADQPVPPPSAIARREAGLTHA